MHDGRLRLMVTVPVQIPVEVLQQIEAARRSESRSSYMRRAVVAALAAEPTPQSDEQQARR